MTPVGNEYTGCAEHVRPHRRARERESESVDAEREEENDRGEKNRCNYTCMHRSYVHYKWPCIMNEPRRTSPGPDYPTERMVPLLHLNHTHRRRFAPPSVPGSLPITPPRLELEGVSSGSNFRIGGRTGTGNKRPATIFPGIVVPRDLAASLSLSLSLSLDKSN